jgi:hypothetical protein
VKSRSLSGAKEARRSSCSGAGKPRTGEGYEVGPLGLDEPPEEPCGVEVGAERAADLRRHVPAARGGAVAEVHVGHLTMPASERASSVSGQGAGKAGRRASKQATDLEDLERSVMAEAEGQRSGPLDAGHGGAGVEQGGEAEEED